MSQDYTSYPFENVKQVLMCVQPPPPTIRDRKDIDELVNSLVGSGTSNTTSRAESVMSSSGMSDSESASQAAPRPSFSAGNFSAIVLPPVLDIPPPPPLPLGRKEIETYSKEVQTADWIPEQSNEEESEDAVRRRIDEEIRKEVERIQLEEEEARQAELRHQEAKKEIPGTMNSEKSLI